MCPSVLSCSNLKLHQTFEVKNIFKQEKIMLQSMITPGLMLTGFRTTRPRLLNKGWLLYQFLMLTVLLIVQSPININNR